MRDSLRQKLIDYIKAREKVHWKDLERFCDQNGARWADNGSRRLRDARDKNKKCYDPNLSVQFYPGTDTIEYYIYGQQIKSPVVNVPDWFFKPTQQKVTQKLF